MEYVLRAIRKHLEQIICVTILVFCVSVPWVYPERIPSAPPLREASPELQEYLDIISDNFHVLSVTTTAPNGSRKGVVGELVLYNNGGTFSIWTNTTSSTVWQQL